MNVYGVTAELIRPGVADVLLAVVEAETEIDAIAEILVDQDSIKAIRADCLGEKGTDEVAHKEDEWAMALCEEYLFNGRQVAVSTERFEV
jgi:hypothetical protein